MRTKTVHFTNFSGAKIRDRIALFKARGPEEQERINLIHEVHSKLEMSNESCVIDCPETASVDKNSPDKYVVMTTARGSKRLKSISFLTQPSQ